MKLMDEEIEKQHRLLLLFKHCASCEEQGGSCGHGASCVEAKELRKHVLACNDPGCTRDSPLRHLRYAPPLEA